MFVLVVPWLISLSCGHHIIDIQFSLGLRRPRSAKVAIKMSGVLKFVHPLLPDWIDARLATSRITIFGEKKQKKKNTLFSHIQFSSQISTLFNSSSFLELVILDIQSHISKTSYKPLNQNC